jgi:hypothetical protein
MSGIMSIYSPFEGGRKMLKLINNHPVPVIFFNRTDYKSAPTFLSLDFKISSEDIIFFKAPDPHYAVQPMVGPACSAHP